MDVETKITLIFKDEYGNGTSIETTFLEILENDISHFQEALEDNEDCSCFNEGQNFCECTPKYEGYGLHEFLINPNK
jgi:hypothetical protein